MKSLKSYSLIIGCGLLSVCLHAWAAGVPLTLGATQTGTISSAGQSNTYTFSASANDVVNLAVVATSGNLSPMIQLSNPSGTVLTSAYQSLPGGACSGASAQELNTFLLTAAGTYTVAVSDCSATNTGNYTIYAQFTDNPSGATNLPAGPTETGTISSAAQSTSYTFSATVNDFVSLSMTATSGNLSPKIRLYNSSGTLLATAYPGFPNAACTGAATTGISTFQLPSTATYTVLAGDCTDANTGNYQISAQLTNPQVPPSLPLGETDTGTISAVAQTNRYSLAANANDVVDWTMVTTSGSLSPKIQLYSSNGTLLLTAYPGYCNGGTLESTYKFTAAGTYTVALSDCSATNTGNYAIYTQLATNPSGVMSLPFGQLQAGLIGSAAQSDSYTFMANASDFLNFTILTTSGNLSPKFRLYDSTGTLLRTAYPGYCNGGLLEVDSIQVPATGTYTMLFGDCSDTNTGNYLIWAELPNKPPAPVGVLWGQVQPGKVVSVLHNASYNFTGSAGNVIDFEVVTTSGSLSPRIRLYNPDGTLLQTAYPGYCNGGTIQMNSVALAQTGTYTMLIGDCSNVQTGSYNLSSLCFGTCPTAAPVLTSISPTSATAGGSAFTLTVDGANFVTGPNSVVQWNGSALNTTYVSSTQLTAAVPASDIAAGGAFPVTVLNPVPQVGPSNAINFTVNGTSPTPITVTTSPTGLSIVVDGTTYTAPQSFSWVAGSNHTVNAPSPQGTGPQYVFSSWSDSGAQSHTIIAPSSATTYTASFTTQYYLTMTAGTGGTVSPASGWYNAGQSVAISASANTGYSFAGWTGSGTGSYTGTTQSPSVTMNGAIGETASFSPLGNTLTAGSASAAPGGTFSIPITLALSTGVSVDALTFGVQITPAGSAPAFTTGLLSFTKSSSIVSTPLTSGLANFVGVAWASLSPALSGTTIVGTVGGTVPTGAVSGQGYTVTVTAVQASLAGNPISINPGPPGTLSLVSTYLVGDIYPFTSDMAPNFGSGTLNLNDLIYMLFVITEAPGYPAPARCSDRFDAMDTYPVDTPTVRGGDGVINLNDLIVELFRVTGAPGYGPPWPTRTSRGGVCPSMATVTTARVRQSSVRPSPEIQGALVLGSAEGTGTSQDRVPVYLQATRDLARLAVAFSLGDQQSQLRFEAAPGIAPSLVQDSQTGLVAAAWLGGLNVPAGERLLLGYVVGPSGSAGNLKIFGASATGLNDNREVGLDVSVPVVRQ